ncbi:MAG: glycosyltransferase family 4 protein [Caldilineaceae bacterium]|nr:glycosyltransferase family 4 protein [Caldilineaceae bacterium]
MIAIDYTPAIRQQAGIGRIVRGQVKALLGINPGYELRLFVTGQISPADQATSPLPLYPTPYIDERNLVRIWHRLDIPLPRVEWIVGGEIELLHATDFVLPPSRARRKVLTIHDLAFLYYPDAAMPGLHRYLNTVVPRSVRRADHILADSHHTARDLHELWQVENEAITVVQGAVDHDFFRPISDGDEQQRVRRKYNIGDQPFILGLSKLQPRKNFSRLIRAFHLAREEACIPHHLVIGGSKGWLFDDIFATVQELGLMGQVHFSGFVDDADLPALYSAADFFAYPSLYEGFGLPILEALACNTPVLAGDNSCLPEAGGPGAIYVNAESVEEIAAGIVRLASDEDLRTRLREDGRTHAASFTWERSARQLLDAYRRVLG